MHMHVWQAAAAIRLLLYRVRVLYQRERLNAVLYLMASPADGHPPFLSLSDNLQRFQSLAALVGIGV
jgi:hypothetical protein